MLTFQHIMCLFEHTPHPTSRIIAATAYPDAIRMYTKLRQYSHFEKSDDGTDTAYMKFPYSMKATKDEVERLIQTSGHRLAGKPGTIGGTTDIELFYAKNRQLERIMAKGAAYHLCQDVTFDKFLRKNVNCQKKSEDEFAFNGHLMNGKQFRQWITAVEQQGVYLLAHRLYDRYGITTNQKWLDENVRPALFRHYPKELATNTYSYMKVDPTYDKLISKADWSKINDGTIPRKQYEKLYDDIQQAMSQTDKHYHALSL